MMLENTLGVYSLRPRRSGDHCLTPPASGPGFSPSLPRARFGRLAEDEIRERNALALAVLDAIEEIGDDAEQRETLDYLTRVVDEDRLSDQPRFGT